MFDCYIKLQQLPDEVKSANKGMKPGAKIPRLDCVAMAGYYEGLKPLYSSKGQLKFYLQQTRGLIKSSDQRRAGYFLMGEKSINFSSIFLQDFGTDQKQCFGYGEPNGNEMLKNGKSNPMKPFCEDAYLFITDPGFIEIEILIIRRGRYLIQGYLKQLANGAFNDALKAMREQAKPIFNYWQ